MASIKATIANFAATPATGYVAPGEGISVSFKITNTGAYVIHGLTVTVWPEDGGIWGDIYQNMSFNLAKSASRTVTIHAPMPKAPHGVNRVKPNMDVYIYYETFSDFDPAKDTASGGQFVRLPFMGLDMRYDPKIPRFSFGRYPTEEGEGGRGTIKCTLAAGANAGYAGLSLKLQWKEEGAASFPGGNSLMVPIASALSGNGATVAPGFVFELGKAYVLRATLTDGFDTAFSEVRLSKSFMNLHLSGCGKGVALGQYSTATEQSPKFECQYPAHFYGGIPQLDYSTSRIDTKQKWIDGSPIYRKVILNPSSVSQNTANFPVGEPSIDKVVGLYGIAVHESSSVYLLPLVHRTTGNIISLHLASRTDNPYVVATGSSGWQVSAASYVIIDYTTNRNLLPMGATNTVDGVTYTVLPDGGIRIRGTCTASTGTASGRGTTLDTTLTGRYRLSIGNVAAIGRDFAVRLNDASNAMITNPQTNVAGDVANAYLDIQMDALYVRTWSIRVEGGKTYDTVIYPKLELVG